MIKKGSKKPLLWTVFCLLFFVSMAHASSKFVIKPMIDTSYLVESNLYKTATDERSVSTLKLSPGLEFVYKTSKSKISAIVFMNVTSYDDLSHVPVGREGSDENDYIGYNVGLSADTKLFTRIETGLDVGRLNTRNPFEKDVFDNSTDISQYSITQIRPWLEYQISDRLFTGFEYHHSRIEYAADIQEDSSLSRIKADLNYELNKFTLVGLEYALWEMDYDLGSSDYTSMEYGGNFSCKFKYFEFAGDLGFHERDFDQSGLNDIQTVFWDISIKGQTLSKFDDDQVLRSAMGQTLARKSSELDVYPRSKSYMSLSFAQNFNTVGSADEYYRADRITLVLGHLFMKKLDVRLESYFQKSDYENDLTDRKDDTYFFSGALAYPVKEWLAMILKAGIERRNSSVAGNDYENAFISSRFVFIYDLGRKLR